MESMPINDELRSQDPPAKERLERTSSKAMVRMRFELCWESAAGRHTDCLVAPTLNLWRDLFPPELERQIMDKPSGHCASHRFAPGEMLAEAREDKRLTIPHARFNRHFMQRGLVQPRAGRFYPRGILEAIPGIFHVDRNPFRLAEVGDRGLRVDLNHPLAENDLDLRVTIEEIWALGTEHGGRCNEIADIVCANGPGMQARWRSMPTDFWSDMPYLRTDPGPDAGFYAKPRFVDHMDTTAIAQVRDLFGRLIKHGSRVLDMMASWHSHLPDHLATGRITGLGMNAEELDANPVIDDRVVQDLNANPRLPFADAEFDTVICTVSVEYLTRPLEVFREIARVLRPGGRLVVTFSNRWFPPKVIRIWEGIHEFERPGLISEYFLESGLFTRLETWSIRGLPRPTDDKYADRIALSDPIHAVWAERVAA